jgi:hypothetical protein
MAQKFELDPNKDATTQIRKTEFFIEPNNPAKNFTYIYYHYKEGQIFKKPEKINRTEIFGAQGGKVDSNDKDPSKDNEENKKHQFLKMINDMESKCHSQIKAHEEQSHIERQQRKDFEKNIISLRQQNQEEEIFAKIIEKSIYEKARDKMKQGKLKVDDAA